MLALMGHLLKLHSKHGILKTSGSGGLTELSEKVKVGVSRGSEPSCVLRAVLPGGGSGG